jgi:hypothetical protein
MLLNASAGIPDIIQNPNLTQKLELNAFQPVTDRLDLDTNERTYLLYLWLYYCKQTTFARKADTNDSSYTLMSIIGQ